ncbi:MAG: zinc metalloprotease [Lacibacter sp.]|nr:zinc metalloprotease [Lacibacter sp.]
MKKVSVLAAVSLLLFFGCSKSVSTKETIEEEVEQTMAEGRRCYSYEVLQAKLKEDPTLQKRMDEIESFTQKYIQERTVAGRLETDNLTMTIPVYVNVLYNNAAQNISDEQIASQIAVLNADFAAVNTDVNKTNTYQTVKAGTTNIRFELAGTIRKQTSVTSWGTNDAMKKSSQGGINPTNPTTSLNMWSCNLGSSLLGYAQFPGGSSATDGVVILYSAFGSRAIEPSGTYVNTYDLGRTATHEVGHWLNLRHIWGDRRCGDDLVGDTPAHDGANYNCPLPATSKCTGKPIKMTMNYMDYTADACMYMFTIGQEARMRATFAVGGPRATLR